MSLIFNVAEIRKQRLDAIVPRLFVKSPRDHREPDRIYEEHESQYRMLAWLGWQFNGINILDLGTRVGTSAICLADNPANRVITCDITYTYKSIDIRPFLDHVGVNFIHGDALSIPATTLNEASIISLDISHNGTDEASFLTLLETIGFDGIVIMDDVNFPRKFKALKQAWENIKLPKLLLPKEIAHDTGTGIVIYGQHDVRVVLSSDDVES